MHPINIEIDVLLSDVRAHGDFYVSGSTPMASPNLQIAGLGLVSLPAQQHQLDALLNVAQRAPYGRGAETIVDTEVRRCWQIAADQLEFGGRHWPAAVDALVVRVCQGLGVSGGVTAELYKLLVYDTGSFFVEHRDSEKSPGMFATLVLVLPSVYEGGELLIRHGCKQVNLDLNQTDLGDVAYAAFYADCVHEVRPITSGVRLVLTYNLLRKGRELGGSPPQYPAQQARAVACLRRWHSDLAASVIDTPQKLVYPLEHAYSAAELGFASLKNADAARGLLLWRAAQEAGCDIHLAQVLVEESGSAEYTQYPTSRYRGYRTQDEDEFEIGEVFDHSASLSHWCSPSGDAPSWGDMEMLDEELCPPGCFDDEEADEQEFHEATGNEGVSFERSYRRAALVLWPRSHRLRLVAQAGLSSALPYLEQLVQSGHAATCDQADKLQAPQLAAELIAQWPTQGMHGGEQAARMLRCLHDLGDAGFVEHFLDTVPAKGVYDGVENENMVLALTVLERQRMPDLLDRIIAANASYAMQACADLLYRLHIDLIDAKDLLLPAAHRLLATLLGRHISPKRANAWERPSPADSELVVNILTVFCCTGNSAMAEQALSHMLRYDVDEVLTPAALILCEFPETCSFAPVQRLRDHVRAYLRQRIAQDLQPPQDFSRPAQLSCHCVDCAALARFLADASMESWVFKAAEQRRTHLATTIDQSRSDLNLETQRVGSPHRLLCTKNQASYQRRVKQRSADQQHEQRLKATC